MISLGCRLNIAESEQIRALLANENDVVVVNSCAVTSAAVRQTRQAIRQARKARPEARLLVTGCAAEIERDALAAMPEVDGLIANTAKLDPRAYNCPSPSGDGLGWGLSVPLRTGLQPPPPAPPLKGRGGHTRAFIAVQNGCDHACTFCVIPQGRGESRSLTVAQVLQEVERHLVLGAQEVVLTGVDVTSWGHELPNKPKLGALVRDILDTFPDLARLRMSSLDGIEVDSELFELLARHPRVMPHIHLSLQHGHDLILKRMKRRHSRADAIDLVTRLKCTRPEIAIGADLIAGFPTETGEHHAANLSIIEELGIVHGHIFPYSPRPGTPAARMPQIDGALIRQRAADLRAAVSRVRHRWLEEQVGKPQTILAEADGCGYSESYARVAAPAGTPTGSIVTVTPTQLNQGLLA